MTHRYLLGFKLVERLLLMPHEVKDHKGGPIPPKKVLIFTGDKESTINPWTPTERARVLRGVVK